MVVAETRHLLSFSQSVRFTRFRRSRFFMNLRTFNKPIKLKVRLHSLCSVVVLVHTKIDILSSLTKPRVIPTPRAIVLHP